MARRSLRERNASAIAADPTATLDAAPTGDAPAKAPLTAVPDTPEVQKAAQTSQEAAQEPSSPQSGEAAVGPAKKASVASRPAAGEGRLVLWTPEQIRARMQAERRHTGKRYLDQVLDAIEATYEQLPDLVASASKQETHIQGSIFERIIETEHAARRVQLTIRGVLDSHLAKIDELAASTGAGSRSALVNTALDAYLPHAG